MSFKVIGLVGGFHPGAGDAAATLIVDGNIIASVEEERLTRAKYSFATPPARCIDSVLAIANLKMKDIDEIAIAYSHPEIIEEFQTHLTNRYGFCPPIKLIFHHLAHAASAYYASKMDKTLVAVFDWSGDGISTSIWKGENHKLVLLEKIKRPNSLGIFYAAFTQFLGFDRGDEYKVMGLASYGKPVYNLDRIMDVSNDNYQLNLDIIANTRNMHQIVFGEKLNQLLPNLRRFINQPIEEKHKDLAASAQKYFEIATEKIISKSIKNTGINNLCIAGGAGLNCTSNGKLSTIKAINQIYVPPFPNDTGCSFGAAAIASIKKGVRIEPLTTSQLGPSWSNDTIKETLDLLKCKASYEPQIHEVIAKEISIGSLVGWFQGGLEVGPRALGGRSILANPTDNKVRDKINKYVKFRETFRPFAPSVLLDDSPKYFDFNLESPYMSFIAPVLTPNELPGITHVDGTARLQTVKNDSSIYSKLLNALKEEIGYGMVLNTSFNYMGQPMVCNPKEAIYTFFGTGLDTLALGNWLIKK